MSRVYFHSPTSTAELNGSEQAHMLSLVYDLTKNALQLQDPARRDRLTRLLAPAYADFADAPAFRWHRDFTTSFQFGSGHMLAYQGHPIHGLSLALNTATKVGDDTVKLAARLAGQAEIHCYVEGPNRAWMADLIDAGLASGTFRRGIYVQPRPSTPREQWRWMTQGWDGVTELLRARDDEPVVLSYSVCDSFPNPNVAVMVPPMPDDWRPDGWTAEEWADTDDQDEWWKDDVHGRWCQQGEAVQWAECLQVIRDSGQGLEMNPDDWETFHFTHGLTVDDLFADDWEARIADGLGLARS